jgi:hypothetical protein
MDRTIANQIVLNVWNGINPPDGRLSEALRVAGISRAEFDRLLVVARKTEVRHHGRCVLTPAGCGRR